MALKASSRLLDSMIDGDCVKAAKNRFVFVSAFVDLSVSDGKPLGPQRTKNLVFKFGFCLHLASTIAALLGLYSAWTRTRGSAFSQVVRFATRRS